MVDAQRPWKGPILDNHFHLNRNGRYLDAAKDFKNVGGTHLVLVHCPDFSSPPTSLSEHKEAYADTIELDGVKRQVDMLKWGRVALVFQTPDGEVTGVWDNNSREWVTLDDSYRRGVRDGLRIARKTQTADLVLLPVRAPGE